VCKLYGVAKNFSPSQSVKVDWFKLKRKVLYCFATFAIINEKLIKEDRPMRVVRSARRRRRSHCNIMAARGEGGFQPPCIILSSVIYITFGEIIRSNQSWQSQSDTMGVLSDDPTRYNQQVRCGVYHNSRTDSRRNILCDVRDDLCFWWVFMHTYVCVIKLLISIHNWMWYKTKKLWPIKAYSFVYNKCIPHLTLILKCEILRFNYFIKRFKTRKVLPEV